MRLLLAHLALTALAVTLTMLVLHELHEMAGTIALLTGQLP